jgi:CRP-like cAMP-binding protein
MVMPIQLLEQPNRAESPSPVGRNRLLAAMPSEDFSLIARHMSEVHLPRGLILHQAGDTIEHVYFIHYGIVSLMADLPGGQSVEIATIGRDGAIGAMAGLGSRTALNRAVVQVPVRAARIAAARLSDLVQQSGPIRDMIIWYGEALSAQIQQLVACNAVHEVPARLARWLLRAEDLCGSPVLLTQENLSQLLGVRRTTVTMVCRGMQLQGLIHIGRGATQIIDTIGVERSACPCYRALRGAAERAITNVRGKGQKPHLVSTQS